MKKLMLAALLFCHMSVPVALAKPGTKPASKTAAQAAMPLWQMEIRVNSLQRATAFYQQVFDWKITKMGDAYAMIDTGKPPIGALWEIGDSGMPLGIAHYLLTTDCVAAAQRWKAAGARVVVERTEVAGSGTWTDVLDPWNNEVAFWQPAVKGQPTLTGSGANAVQWLEWGVADVNAAVQFYAAQAGWRCQADKVGNSATCSGLAVPVKLLGGEEGAHRRGIVDFVGVANLDAALARVKAAGGQVMGEVRTGADGQRTALVLDPDQNRLGLVERKAAK